MADWRFRLAEADRAAEAQYDVEPSNAQFNWDEFDPDQYVTQNYRDFQSDDLKIVQTLRDFFAEHASGQPSRWGIDVGSGANLYPAMALLPFCAKIDLREFGRRNVTWLRNEISNEQKPGYSAMWDQYWQVFAANDAYHQVEEPRTALAQRARVVRQSIFDLPERQWDMGTMSFVAESLTTQKNEFNAATQRFVSALKPGAPFAAAFMRDSSGYYVGTVRFPAVAIREADVEQCLAPLSEDLDIITVRSDALRRTGYHNMIVATGKAARRRS